MLELKLSEVMKKDKKPQVQSRKYFDWIYFELYNILLVGLKELPNIRKEPFTDQLVTIQRSKNKSTKRWWRSSPNASARSKLR
jgi:hypothetical protein